MIGRKKRAMPYRSGIELDDVEARYGEDMTGQEVTVRLEDGTEVQGQLHKYREDMTGDDTEAHSGRIDLEVDDAQADVLKAANDRGEPVYVRFPDGAEVRGHTYYLTGDDVEGYRRAP